jgi:hypothetical protein
MQLRVNSLEKFIRESTDTELRRVVIDGKFGPPIAFVNQQTCLEDDVSYWIENGPKRHICRVKITNLVATDIVLLPGSVMNELDLAIDSICQLRLNRSTVPIRETPLSHAGPSNLQAEEQLVFGWLSEALYGRAAHRARTLLLHGPAGGGV